MSSNQLKEIKVISFRFSSYMKIIILIFLTAGMTSGLLIFLLSLLGVNVQATFFSSDLSGITAGIISLVYIPAMFVIIGFILSFIFYFPFTLLLKAVKGIEVDGVFQFDTNRKDQ